MDELQSLQNDVDTIINTKVKQNNARQITGIVLNGVLRSITSFVITALGLFYTRKEIDEKLTAIELTPGADGKSAYQIWLDAGNTGTEAEYRASLKGAPGTSAPLVKFKYSVDGITNWHEEATSNDFFFCISVDNGLTWDNALKFKGSEGIDGKSSFQVWQAIAGNEAKSLTDYWSFLATTGGFSFNLIYYNNTELVMSQPKAWTIQTVTYTADITLLEYSINNAAFAAITNGANNLSIAANAVINFRITFASGKIQTSINLTGIY